MQFRMQELLSKAQTLSINEQRDVSELFRERPDVLGLSPLHIQLTVKPEAGLVTVEGTLDIDMKLACSRCLEETETHLTIPFFEQFKQVETLSEEEEDDIVEIAGDNLDLTPYVDEYVFVFMPLAPRCKEDCKGLCPQCGNDLNVNQCGCSTERIDPRLASLKDFFKE